MRRSARVLNYVHDIHLARIAARSMVICYRQVPGRVRLTNGDAPYAGGSGQARPCRSVRRHPDIHADDYVPKPIRAPIGNVPALRDRPQGGAVREDMARNLDRQKHSVCDRVIDNGLGERGDHGADPAFIDYHIADIGAWLTEILTEESDAGND